MASASTTAVEVSCAECGSPFMLSARNELRHRREGLPHRCRECRLAPRIKPEDVAEAREWWLSRYSLDELRSWPEW